MHFWIIFTLVGLILEIIGAFILAADAIGLNKFLIWINFLLNIKEQLTGEKRVKDTVLRPSAARITGCTDAATSTGLAWVSASVISAGVRGAMLMAFPSVWWRVCGWVGV